MVKTLTGVNVPIEILAAEIDEITPPALVKQFQEILAARVHEVRKGLYLFIYIFFVSR